MSLLYSADKLRLLKPGVKTFLQTSFDRDGHNLRPSNIDNIVGKIYEDLKRLSDSLAPDYFWTAMGDTPNSFSGASESFIGVNTGETALEYKSLKYDNATETLYGTGETLNLGTNTNGILKLQFSTVGNIDYKADLPILSGGIEKARFQQTTGFLGLGTTTPTEYLHSSGGIRVGTATNTNSGTFQWNGTNFQGHNGSGWVNLDITDHTLLSNIGTNTHAQIDAHIADTANPHGVTAAQVGNTTAQWNADRIEGNITNIGTLGAGEDGYALTWDNATSRFVMAEAGATGLVAIYNGSGVPTFYADLSTAITAASAGDTVQIYSDITETGAVTITCKNGVNINFNGFTYTLNNASTDNAFSVPTGVSMEMFNGKVLRTGGTGSSSNSLAIHTTGTGTFKANNMVFESDFGTAGYIGSSDRSFYGGTFYSSNRGVFVDNSNLYNAICNGGTGAGIQIQNNGKAYSCEGYSSGSYGIYNNGSNAYFCVGRSDGNYGYWGAGGNSHDCKGYSTANVGANISANGSFSNIYGFSSSSRGVSVVGNGVGVMGYSTASQGVYYSNGGGSSHVIQDVKATSTAAAGIYILLNAGKVEFSNLDVGSRWNNASGHGIIVAGSDNDVILNGGSIRVENASANCLYHSAARSFYFNSLSFVNSTTAVNANITNLQTNTPDAYGNILVG